MPIGHPGQQEEWFSCCILRDLDFSVSKHVIPPHPGCRLSPGSSIGGPGTSAPRIVICNRPTFPARSMQANADISYFPLRPAFNSSCSLIAGKTAFTEIYPGRDKPNRSANAPSQGQVRYTSPPDTAQLSTETAVLGR